MVEGPGCKLKGIKIKAKLRGQTVHAVEGNAVQKETKKKNSEGVSTFHQLIGRELDDVQTLGKELFMYFGDLCLRVHFLMAGQSFINNMKVDNDSGGKAETASLELQMSRDLLTFRNSAADMRPAAICKQKYQDLNNLDICSPVFNFKRAIAMVMEQQGRQVCDVLLDQLILPGVGNIIKNEALFDSGIRPSSKVEELKEEHITHLVKMTRDFTNIFYVCRRDGKPLYPYYKIYSKRKCKQCEGKVTITRLGDDSARVTYYCENCQTNDLKKCKRTLPKKNSLLGWVKSSSEKTDDLATEWSCSACTLLNPASQTSCTVCHTPRGTTGSSTASSASGNVEDVICIDDSPVQGGNNIVSLCKGVKRQLEESSPQPAKKMFIFKGTGISSPSLTPARNTGNIPANGINTINMKSQSLNATCSTQKGNNSKCQAVSATSTTRSSQSVSQKQGNNDTEVVPSKIPACPTHKKRCNMKEVRKEGTNKGRWFFSCVLRNCNFFEWADTKFPLCPDHGKPCTIRTVLKLGPNNGRKFFACKMPKNKQCKFFEWALGYDTMDTIKNC